MNLASMVREFEASVNVSVSFHDYYDCLTEHAAGIKRLHAHRVCAGVKKFRAASCTRCDKRLALQHLSKVPDGFWKRCHAGILELYLPIRRDDTLVAGMFVGLWRWGGGQRHPADMLLDPGPPLRKLQPIVAELDVLDKATQRRVTVLSRMLRLSVEQLLRESQEKSLHSPSREAQIVRFVESYFREAVSIGDLARYLHLSGSRTGQLVKHHFETTFPSLINRTRLDHACNLLTRTEMTVTEIAMDSGFEDPGYFHRVFKKALKRTPLGYRRHVRKRGGYLLAGLA